MQSRQFDWDNVEKPSQEIVDEVNGWLQSLSPVKSRDLFALIYLTLKDRKSTQELFEIVTERFPDVTEYALIAMLYNMETAGVIGREG